jgi:hypothetical protein
MSARMAIKIAFIQVSISCPHSVHLLSMEEGGGIINGYMATESRTSRKMSTPAFASLLIVGGVLILIAAFFIGRSDGGQINVAATIQSSNQNAPVNENGEQVPVNAVPQVFQRMTNGGLVPSENQEEQAPVSAPTEDTASTTATTTDATSTPTEENASTEEPPSQEDATSAGN